MTDVDPSVDIMNDPRVFAWMGRSTPYLPKNAETWLDRVKAKSDSVILELTEGTFNEKTLHTVSGCPVRHLREVMKDGTDVFIGDVGIERSNWADVIDDVERQCLVEENEVRKQGDPEIAWQMGGEQATVRADNILMLYV